MLSRITIREPKTKQELVKAVSSLPQGVRFSVHEVQSNQDKQRLQRSVDACLRKGSCSVILIENDT